MGGTAVLMVVLLSGILQSPSAATTEKYGYTDRYVLTFVHTGKNHADAVADCQTRGEQLLKVDGESVTDAIVRFYKSHWEKDGKFKRKALSYWFGAKSEESKWGPWLWTDGSKAGLPKNTSFYNNWYDGEPNNKKAPFCMGTKHPKATTSEDAAKWVDFGCDNQFSYICQRAVPVVYTSKYELTFINAKKTWANAKASCAEKGGRLAKVNTSELKTTLKNMIHKNESYWIGASDSANDGNWVWTDGTAVESKNWEKSKGRTPGNCATIDSSAAWAGHSCLKNLSYICQRDLPIRVSVGLSELTFHGTFTGEKNKTHAQARKACGDSSRLVEIDSKEKMAVIEREASLSRGKFWTGGERVTGTSTKWWKWNSEVFFYDTNEAWKSGYPKTKRSCVSTDVGGWENNNCDDKMAYICEQVQVNNIQTSSSSIVVGEDDNYKVNCTASGLPVPKLEWQSPSQKLVSATAGTQVYQVNGTGFSTLILENAMLSDSGRYQCRAWNHPSGGKVEKHKTTNVNVTGIPEIEEIVPQSCDSSLLVHWKPSRHALGSKHSIIVQNDKGEILPDDLSVTPTNANTHSTMTKVTMTGSTMYTIRVKVSKNRDVNFSVAKNAVTGGLPNRVESAKLIQDASNQSCLVQWARPNMTPESVIRNYMMTIQSKLVQTRHNTAIQPNITESVKSSKLSFSIPLQPNRNYTIAIQAKTCAGPGPAATAQGTCMTKSGVPSSIPVPAIAQPTDGKGIPTLSFNAPDESNGLISCVFIIIEASGSDTNGSPSELDTLHLANSSDGSNGSYIAIAVSVTSLNTSKTNHFKLGTGEVTTCNIHNTGKTGGRKRRATGSKADGEYSGQNLKLKDKEEYSVAIVSATPAENGTVEFQTSPAKKFTNGAEPKQGGTPWLIPLIVVIAVVLLLAVIVLIVVLRKKRKAKAADLAPIPMDPIRQPEPAAGAPVYENVSRRQQDAEVSQAGILMSDLEEVYNALKGNENHEFLEQFKNIVKLSTESMPASDFASDPNLKKKNRYKNILPFDHTRVPVEGNETKYINACYINGFDQDRKFIATQGPLPGTVNDFWLMVVEQKCGVIVMLTKHVEADKVKCEKYWPNNGETVQYGSVIVESRDEVNFNSFVRRTMQAKLKDEVYDNPLIITQYQFLKWPDHGAPRTTSYLVRMHRAIIETQKKQHGNPPMIVHCSAGAGRTGTLVGYDILLDQYQKTNRVDVHDCVMNMRRQRVEMVQNCDQYIFLHKLVLESYLFGVTDMESHVLEDRLREVASNGVKGSMLEMEFMNLSKLGPMKDSKSVGQSTSNAEKNMDRHIVPYDSNLVKIVAERGESGGPYVNASWVESYEIAGIMIAAQGPMKSTAKYFWRAVLDNQVTTIVMLNQLKGGGKDKCIQYWPESFGETTDYDGIAVTLTAASAEGSIVKRSLELARKKAKKTITHYQYSGWEEKTCPEDGGGVISLITKLQESMRESEGFVLVHCSDGAGRTGAFCAIMNLIERLKLENRVDVFRAVKDLRDGRPGMVQTVDQYIFCYKAVVDYLKSFELYSNF